MANLVGTKGQVVIEKEIRDRLGVKPGWQALQILVDDHLEVYFVPPPHNRSLAGCLAPFINRTVSEEDETGWDHSIADAVVEDFLEGSPEKETGT